MASYTTPLQQPDQPPFIVVNFIQNNINFRTRESSNYMHISQHAILAFIIPLLLNFIEVKFEGKSISPFDGHPRTIMVAVSSLLAYCSAFSFYLTFSSSPPSPSRARFSARVMTLFGFISMASLSAILFPKSLWFLPYFICCCVFSGKFYSVIRSAFKRIRERYLQKLFGAMNVLFQLNARTRRRHSLLPISLGDVQ